MPRSCRKNNVIEASTSYEGPPPHPGPLMDAVACQYRKAADGGYGGKDMAAIFRAFRL
jgi:hypothetical protein